MDTKIHTLAGFQKEIASLGDGEFVYRGQSDKEWNVTSTAYRRLSKNGEKTFLLYEFIKYHKNLISNARNYGEVLKDKTDLDLLAELQHYGAATSLIDFSYSAVIALWFACQDSEKNGKVFCLNAKPGTFSKITSEDKKETIEKILTLTFRNDKNTETGKSLKSEAIKTAIWQPSLSNNRIIKQDSVFIFNQSGEIKDTDFDKILIVLKDNKVEILKDLEKLTGTTETRIYPDFYGFAQSNAFNKPYKVETEVQIFKKALDYHLAGELQGAIKDYGRVIELNAEHVDAYYNRGIAKASSGWFEEAIKDYSRAIELKPDYVNAYNGRGAAKMNLGEPEEAIKDYSRAIELDPDDAIAYSNRGIAKASSGELKEAIKDYSRAIELKPDDAMAYNGRGAAKINLGEPEEAIKDYSRAIELNPDDAMAYNGRGVAKVNLGEPKEAIKDYSRAIELNPDDVIAYSNRGTAKASLGELEEAIKDYNRAIELKPDYVNAYNGRGAAKMNLGEPEEAIKDYSLAIELKPDYTDAYYNRGIANAYLSQLEEAIKDYGQARELYNKQGNTNKAKICQDAINKLKNK